MIKLLVKVDKVNQLDQC